MLRAAIRAILFLCLAVGCGHDDNGDRLLIGVASDLGALLPIIRNTALDGEVNEQLYLSLSSAYWSGQGLEYGVDDLSLAQSWEFSQDSTVLTYRLRPNAVWSDGAPITSEDVVFTFELLRRPEIGSPYMDRWQQLDSVVERGRREVAFHFKRRHPDMLRDTRIGIVPAHTLATAAENGAALMNHRTLREPGRRLVVSGPYWVAEWRRGDRLVLEANPLAFTARPHIETVVFRIIPDMNTRLVELINGSIDVIELVGPLPEGRAAVLGEANVRVELAPDRNYDYIAWNGNAFEPFRDPAIRLALSLAIDRGAILEGLGIESYAQPAAGPYPPAFEQLVAFDAKPDRYMPDSARSILSSRGWRDSDGDGVLDRDGEALSFKLLTQAGNDRRASAAELIRIQLEAVGVRIEVRSLEFNTLLGLVFDERAFDAALLGWQVPLEVDYLAVNFWPPDSRINMTGYASAELDNVIRLARAASTAQEAAPLWGAAAQIIAADRPFAFLWYFDDVVLVNDRVRGTEINTYGVYYNLYEWRLE